MTVVNKNGKLDTEATARQFIDDTRDSAKLQERRDRAHNNQDFENGLQWSKTEAEVYSDKGVDPVTINECRPAVKGMVGMQIQDQQEIKVRPRKNATEVAARVYSEILKHCQDLAFADYKYTELFKQGMTDPEAFLVVTNDRGMNENGQPRFKVYAQADVDVDPNSDTYDLNGNESEHDGAEFVILKDWVPISYLNAKYPEMQDEIASATTIDPSAEGNVDSQVERIAQWAVSDGNQYIDDDEFSNDDTDKNMRDRYRYRIKTVYWRQVVEGIAVADRTTGLVKKFSDSENARKFRKIAKTSERFTVEDMPVYKLHKTVILGNAFQLESVEDPFGPQITDYNVFRFATFWKSGIPSAFLDDIVALNREKNIHRTQNIKLLNSLASSGYIVDKGTPKDLAKLAKFGSMDNIILSRQTYGNIIKQRPNALDAGKFAMDQQFSADMQNITGIDQATLGLSTSGQESGRARFLQQNANKRSAEMIISHNFFHTLDLVGNFLLKLIRLTDVYTDVEIRNVVAESSMIDKRLMDKARRQLQQRTGASLPEPKPLPPITPETIQGIRPADRPEFMQTVQSGTEAATQYLKEYPGIQESFEEVVKEEAIEMLLEELNNDADAEYGIKVTLAPSGATSRLSTLADIQAAREAGIPAPPDMMVDMMDIPQASKEEWKDFLKTQQQQPVPA